MDGRTGWRMRKYSTVQYVHERWGAKSDDVLLESVTREVVWPCGVNGECEICIWRFIFLEVIILLLRVKKEFFYVEQSREVSVLWHLHMNNASLCKTFSCISSLLAYVDTPLTYFPPTSGETGISDVLMPSFIAIDRGTSANLNVQISTRETAILDKERRK